MLYIVSFILLLIFTFYDLNISMTLFNQNIFGITFEAIGELPFTIILVLALAIYLKTNKSKITKLLCFILWILFSLSASFMTYNYLSKHIAVSKIIIMILTLIILLISYLPTRLIKIEQYPKARQFAKMAIWYFMIVILVMNGLKMLWGRMRFVTMDDPLQQFTPWYKICYRGKFDNAYASFPSGHAMNATGILMLTLLDNVFDNLKDKQQIIKIFCILWIILVCISRVMMGAHFASDVTVGFVLSLTIFKILKWRFYEKV